MSYPGALNPKERQKRNVLWLEAPRELRQAFVEEVNRHVKAVGVAKAKEIAWQRFMRLRAWHRRAGDAKDCSRCGAEVLWRWEGRRSVAVDRTGHLHACGEGEATA